MTGSSSVGIENAVKPSIAKTSESVRNICWFKIVDTRGHVENDKVAYWQGTLKIGFTLEN